MAHFGLFLRFFLFFALLYINACRGENNYFRNVDMEKMFGKLHGDGSFYNDTDDEIFDDKDEAVFDMDDEAPEPEIAFDTDGEVVDVEEAGPKSTKPPTPPPDPKPAVTIDDALNPFKTTVEPMTEESTTEETTTEETTPETTTEKIKIPRVNVLFTYEDPYHEKLANTALEYLRTKVLKMETRYEIGHVRFVNMVEEDPIKDITLLCKEVDAYPPDLVIDLTKFGIPSESVKIVVRWLQLPTISASVGQPGDIREWRDLTESEQKYLVQISPPTDSSIQVMKPLALYQNLSNLAIIYDENYEMFHHYHHLLKDTSTKHVMIEVDKKPKPMQAELKRLQKVGYTNFFVASMETQTIEYIIEMAEKASSKVKKKNFFDKMYSWYSLSMEASYPNCTRCRVDSRILHFRPQDLQLSQKIDWKSAKLKGNANDVFYVDLVMKSIVAVGTMKVTDEWPENKKIIRCSTYKYNAYPEVNLNLKEAFKNAARGRTLGREFVVSTNGRSHVNMTLTFIRVSLDSGLTHKTFNWSLLNPKFISADPTLTPYVMRNHQRSPVYRIVTVIQPPFVYLRKNCKLKHEYDNCYDGYVIELLNELRRRLNFNYTIFHTDRYGFMAEKLPHDWDGMIKMLKYQEVDIAVGAISVYPEREAVMDFTYPIYDLVGVQILMKKEKSQTSLFKFLTVLENDVWMCILGAYFFTSALMWIFDRWSPHSYQNNREKYEDDEEKREFTLRECLWFCMTSLTPQGGGEAPKNLSGRLVAATWWLFGFIIIASYTANLAAFLTVSRLEAPIESLDDLIKQYKVQYAPVKNSSTWWHFDRMAEVEHRFYEAWKDMSLNDSLTDFERSVLAVWEYPVSDKYTKIWQSILENDPPDSAEKAITKTRSTEPDPNAEEPPEEFAWIGEATEIQYTEMTTCGFRVVGNEFALNPYAFGVQKGSPLKQVLSREIRRLEHLRYLEWLKHKWWNRNRERVVCSTADDVAEGISIHNIGGVFVVILVGFAMTLFATVLEFWSYWRKNIAYDLSEVATEAPSRTLSAAFAPVEKADFHAQYSEKPGAASPVEY